MYVVCQEKYNTIYSSRKLGYYWKTYLSDLCVDVGFYLKNWEKEDT